MRSLAVRVVDVRISRDMNTGHSRTEVRDKILTTATDLFYKQGIRAVGVDLVVEKAGVAKTSLYRHFGTKDDLVVAFLQRMDQEFWQTWIRSRHSMPTTPERNSTRSSTG